VFLDEVGEMSLRMQALLLRFLESGELQRVGSDRAHTTVDVRVIAATNRELHQRIGEKAFREDLYYRLNVVSLDLPPLRERLEDIGELTSHFMDRFFRERGERPRALSPMVERAFHGYPWPGNVRELENACERIAQTCRCEQVKFGCVPASVLFHARLSGDVPITCDTPSAVTPVSLDDRLREVETRLIIWALKLSHGNKSKAAELLHVKRSTLGDRIRKLGLDHLGGED
jgi:transcriptional regulator with GAF, ATPase, and Fis domain